jgi:hypothetical protein
VDRSVEQVNRALIELFDAFFICAPGHRLPDGVGLDAGNVMIEPSLRSEVAGRLLSERMANQGVDRVEDLTREAPPMGWIGALDMSGSPQETWHFNSGELPPSRESGRPDTHTRRLQRSLSRRMPASLVPPWYLDRTPRLHRKRENHA